MRILIFGGSGLLGWGLPEPDRFPAQLAALLRERLFTDEVEVTARSWGRLPEAQLGPVISEIVSRKPDYLLLSPIPLWVTFPVVELAFMRRTPRQLHGLLNGALRINRRIQKRLFNSAWPWLLYLYSEPFIWLGRLAGARPLYTVPQALDAVEQVIVAARRLEMTETLVLSFPPESIHQIQDHPSPYLRRLIRPEHLKLAEQFIAGIHDLCRRHSIRLVDPWTGLSSDYQADGFHPGSESNRLRAALLCDVIAGLESGYSHSPGQYAGVGVREQGAGGAPCHA